eukprot:EG_transcript_22073
MGVEADATHSEAGRQASGPPEKGTGPAPPTAPPPTAPWGPSSSGGVPPTAPWGGPGAVGGGPAKPPPVVLAQPCTTRGEWNTSLCGCLGDLPLCCLSLWLPCIPAGRTLAWVEGKPESSCLYILVVYIFSMFGGYFFVEFYNRVMLREKFKIDGSCCEDCLVSWFCLFCASQQHARQVGCQTCSGPTEPVR